jgi:hypothetical protein
MMKKKVTKLKHLVCLLPRTTYVYDDVSIKRETKSISKANLFEQILNVNYMTEEFNCTLKYLKNGTIAIDIEEFIEMNFLSRNEKRKNIMLIVKTLGAISSLSEIGCEYSLNDFYIITVNQANQIYCDTNDYAKIINPYSTRGKKMMLETIKYNNNIGLYSFETPISPAEFLNEQKGVSIKSTNDMSKFALAELNKFEKKYIINLEYNYLKATLLNEISRCSYINAIHILNLLVEKINKIAVELELFDLVDVNFLKKDLKTKLLASCFEDYLFSEEQKENVNEILRYNSKLDQIEERISELINDVNISVIKMAN